jgi:hypothetical protein
MLTCEFFSLNITHIGINKEVEQLMANKDLYHVAVKPGIDGVFNFGVIAVLDHIHGKITRSC